MADPIVTGFGITTEAATNDPAAMKFNTLTSRNSDQNFC